MYADMLDTLDLTDKAKRRAQGLTADEKQKISLGRGLVRYDVNAILFDGTTDRDRSTHEMAVANQT